MTLSDDKKTLVFLVESPFSERDWDRFGIADLLSIFDVRILDFTPLVRPTLWQSKGSIQISGDRVTTIFEESEAMHLVDRLRPKACISNLGEGELRSSIFKELRRRKVLTSEFQLGAMPTPDTSQLSSMERVEFRLKQASSLTQIPHILSERWRRRRLGLDLPDLFFRAGIKAAGKHPQSGREIIEVHSLDYEAFRESAKPTPIQNSRTVVYLDQDIGYHSDLQTLKMRSPATPSVFYAELGAYFRWLQDHCGLTVVVCPHPRASRAQLSERFPLIKISNVSTAQEIYGSRAVLGHVSTSFSFATLARRPTIILTTDEISRSWYWPYIQLFTEELSSPLVNLSDPSTWIEPPALLSSQQRDAFDTYQRNYLRAYAGPDRRLWTMIGEALLQKVDG
jgi:hypothetical protein